MYRKHRNTKKATRAIEMIASIYHIPRNQIRNDGDGVEACYRGLEGLGFEWVADEQEWLNPSAKNPREAEVITLVFGSPSHSIDEAASLVVKALEAQGYKVANTDLIIDGEAPDAAMVRMDVVR